jgi:hypothetical protein
LKINVRFFYLILIFILLYQSPDAFSQSYRGIYKTAPFPAGAPLPPKTSDNVLEFPIKLTKAIIKLKPFRHFEFIETNLDGSNPKILRGRWISSGKTITLEFQPSNNLGKITLEFVKMKSGEYIKLVGDYFQYYKKE